MKKLIYRILLSIYAFCISASACSHELLLTNKFSSDEDLKIISFYQGYLIYKNILENSQIAFDFEQIIEGMQKAHQAEEHVKLNEDEIKDAIERFQENLLKQRQEEGLAEANSFLDKITNQEGIEKLVDGQLYFKVIKKGEGTKVQEESSPYLKYVAKTLRNGKENIEFEVVEPKAILLKSTIVGFSKGVRGMQEGEKRILYIHPDLAYGAVSGRVNPNSLMIFEVEVVKTGSN